MIVVIPVPAEMLDGVAIDDLELDDASLEDAGLTFVRIESVLRRIHDEEGNLIFESDSLLFLRTLWSVEERFLEMIEASERSKPKRRRRHVLDAISQAVADVAIPAIVRATQRP